MILISHRWLLGLTLRHLGWTWIQQKIFTKLLVRRGLMNQQRVTQSSLCRNVITLNNHLLYMWAFLHCLYFFGFDWGLNIFSFLTFDHLWVAAARLFFKVHGGDIILYILQVLLFNLFLFRFGYLFKLFFFFSLSNHGSLFCSMPKDEAQLYAANELYVLLANTSVYIFCFPFYTWVLKFFFMQFVMLRLDSI